MSGLEDGWRYLSDSAAGAARGIRVPISLREVHRLLQAGVLSHETQVHHHMMGWRWLGHVLLGSSYIHPQGRIRPPRPPPETLAAAGVARGDGAETARTAAVVGSSSRGASVVARRGQAGAPPSTAPVCDRSGGDPAAPGASGGGPSRPAPGPGPVKGKGRGRDVIPAQRSNPLAPRGPPPALSGAPGSGGSAQGPQQQPQPAGGGSAGGLSVDAPHPQPHHGAGHRSGRQDSLVLDRSEEEERVVRGRRRRRETQRLPSPGPEPLERLGEGEEAEYTTEEEEEENEEEEMLRGDGGRQRSPVTELRAAKRQRREGPRAPAPHQHQQRPGMQPSPEPSAQRRSMSEPVARKCKPAVQPQQRKQSDQPRQQPQGGPERPAPPLPSLSAGPAGPAPAPAAAAKGDRPRGQTQPPQPQPQPPAAQSDAGGPPAAKRLKVACKEEERNEQTVLTSPGRSQAAGTATAKSTSRPADGGGRAAVRPVSGGRGGARREKERAPEAAAPAGGLSSHEARGVVPAGQGRVQAGPGLPAQGAAATQAAAAGGRRGPRPEGAGATTAAANVGGTGGAAVRAAAAGAGAAGGSGQMPPPGAAANRATGSQLTAGSGGGGGGDGVPGSTSYGSSGADAVAARQKVDAETTRTVDAELAGQEQQQPVAAPPPPPPAPPSAAAAAAAAARRARQAIPMPSIASLVGLNGAGPRPSFLNAIAGGVPAAAPSKPGLFDTWCNLPPKRQKGLRERLGPVLEDCYQYRAPRAGRGTGGELVDGACLLHIRDAVDRGDLPDVTLVTHGSTGDATTARGLLQEHSYLLSVMESIRDNKPTPIAPIVIDVSEYDVLPQPSRIVLPQPSRSRRQTPSREPSEHDDGGAGSSPRMSGLAPSPSRRAEPRHEAAGGGGGGEQGGAAAGVRTGGASAAGGGNGGGRMGVLKTPAPPFRLANTGYAPLSQARHRQQGRGGGSGAQPHPGTSVGPRASASSRQPSANGVLAAASGDAADLGGGGGTGGEGDLGAEDYDCGAGGSSPGMDMEEAMDMEEPPPPPASQPAAAAGGPPVQGASRTVPQQQQQPQSQPSHKPDVQLQPRFKPQPPPLKPAAEQASRYRDPAIEVAGRLAEPRVGSPYHHHHQPIRSPHHHPTPRDADTHHHSASHLSHDTSPPLRPCSLSSRGPPSGAAAREPPLAHGHSRDRDLERERGQEREQNFRRERGREGGQERPRELEQAPGVPTPVEGLLPRKQGLPPGLGPGPPAPPSPQRHRQQEQLSSPLSHLPPHLRRAEQQPPQPKQPQAAPPVATKGVMAPGLGPVSVPGLGPVAAAAVQLLAPSPAGKGALVGGGAAHVSPAAEPAVTAVYAGAAAAKGCDAVMAAELTGAAAATSTTTKTAVATVFGAVGAAPVANLAKAAAKVMIAASAAAAAQTAAVVTAGASQPASTTAAAAQPSVTAAQNTVTLPAIGPSAAATVVPPGPVGVPAVAATAAPSLRLSAPAVAAAADAAAPDASGLEAPAAAPALALTQLSPHMFNLTLNFHHRDAGEQLQQLIQRLMEVKQAGKDAVPPAAAAALTATASVAAAAISAGNEASGSGPTGGGNAPLTQPLASQQGLPQQPQQAAVGALHGERSRGDTGRALDAPAAAVAAGQGLPRSRSVSQPGLPAREQQPSAGGSGAGANSAVLTVPVIKPEPVAATEPLGPDAGAPQRQQHQPAPPRAALLPEDNTVHFKIYPMSCFLCEPYIPEPADEDLGLCPDAGAMAALVREEDDDDPETVLIADDDDDDEREGQAQGAGQGGHEADGGEGAVGAVATGSGVAGGGSTIAFNEAAINMLLNLLHG